MRGRPRLAAAALATLSLGFASCGGGDEQTTEGRFLPGSPRVGSGGGLSGAAQADCEQWKTASFRQRREVVRQLGQLAQRGSRPGGSQPGQRGAQLPEDRAYDVLEEACSEAVARKIKLYKIYNRALLFAPR